MLPEKILELLYPIFGCVLAIFAKPPDITSFQLYHYRDSWQNTRGIADHVRRKVIIGKLAYKKDITPTLLCIFCFW